MAIRAAYHHPPNRRGHRLSTLSALRVLNGTLCQKGPVRVFLRDCLLCFWHDVRFCCHHNIKPCCICATTAYSVLLPLQGQSIVEDQKSRSLQNPQIASSHYPSSDAACVSRLLCSYLKSKFVGVCNMTVCWEDFCDWSMYFIPPAQHPTLDTP